MNTINIDDPVTEIIDAPVQEFTNPDSIQKKSLVKSLIEESSLIDSNNQNIENAILDDIKSRNLFFQYMNVVLSSNDGLLDEFYSDEEINDFDEKVIEKLIDSDEEIDEKLVDSDQKQQEDDSSEDDVCTCENCMKKREPVQESDSDNVEEDIKTPPQSSKKQPAKKVVKRQEYIEEEFDFSELTDVKMIMTQAGLDSLSKITYNNAIEKDLLKDTLHCSICLVDFHSDETQNQEMLIQVPCGHIYHESCIIEHLRTYSYKCPMCLASCGDHGPDYEVNPHQVIVTDQMRNQMAIENQIALERLAQETRKRQIEEQNAKKQSVEPDVIVPISDSSSNGGPYSYKYIPHKNLDNEIQETINSDSINIDTGYDPIVVRLSSERNPQSGDMICSKSEQEVSDDWFETEPEPIIVKRRHINDFTTNNTRHGYYFTMAPFIPGTSTQVFSHSPDTNLKPFEDSSSFYQSMHHNATHTSFPTDDDFELVADPQLEEKSSIDLEAQNHTIVDRSISSSVYEIDDSYQSRTRTGLAVCEINLVDYDEDLPPLEHTNLVSNMEGLD